MSLHVARCDLDTKLCLMCCLSLGTINQQNHTSTTLPSITPAPQANTPKPHAWIPGGVFIVLCNTVDLNRAKHIIYMTLNMCVIFFFRTYNLCIYFISFMYFFWTKMVSIIAYDLKKNIYINHHVY